ncbi:MAG: Amuc_1099 family pilus-like system protein, partial [Verrucomicrobiales bacterium]
SSLDEWKSKTSPVEATSHPPYWRKIMFVDRKQKNFSIKFAADNDPQFQININDQGRKSTQFTKVGETFYDGRFTVIGYEKKSGKNKVGIEANQSVLKIKDHSSGGELSIVVSEETNYPTYFGQFNFTLDPAQKEFFVRVGESFTLVKEPAVSYKLEEIDPTGSFATLQLADGSKVKLDKGILPEVAEPGK